MLIVTMVFQLKFSNSSRENKENHFCDCSLDICVPNYHKILPTLALNFSKNYWSFEKPLISITQKHVSSDMSKSFRTIWLCICFFILLLSVWISSSLVSQRLMINCLTIIQVKLNLEMLAFEERGKPVYPEKKLSEQCLHKQYIPALKCSQKTTTKISIRWICEGKANYMYN